VLGPAGFATIWTVSQTCSAAQRGGGWRVAAFDLLAEAVRAGGYASV
jgi:hypothetical protein